jgi:hypothetical protein
MSQPAVCSWVVTALAAPGTPEALAARTGTWGGAVVVVVVGVGGWVVVVTVGPAAVPDGPAVVGWMTPRSRTVLITKAARTMTALIAVVF